MDFLAFPSSFIGGATVAASSNGTTGNGTPQIIVGSNAGMKTTVEVFNYAPGSSTSPPSLAIPAATFYPFSTSTRTFTGGVSLAVARLTSAPIDSIVVGAGTGGGSLVDIWGWNGATSSFSSLSGGTGFAAFGSSPVPINVAVVNGGLSNGVEVASSILAVQSSGGTTGQVVQLKIASVSPLVLSPPVALPNNGGYPAGPNTIAVINNLQPGAPLVAKAPVKPPATPAATAAPTPATKPATTTTTTSTTKPATTTVTTTAIKSAAAVVTSSTNKTTTIATKPVSIAQVAAIGKKLP
jgi:hypothetical protein